MSLDVGICSITPPIQVSDGNMTTNVAATSAPLWVTGTTYAKDFVVFDMVSKLEYVSLQAGNQGHPLATSPLWWKSRGVENRLRMFDGSLSTATKNPDEIKVVLNLKKVVTTLGLLNVVARNVIVRVYEVVNGQEVNRLGPRNVRMTLPSKGTYSSWHFDPIERDTRLLLADLPRYSQAYIEIRILNPGGVAACGMLVIGKSILIGATQYGASVGIDDYSVNEQDEFGEFKTLERGYSDRAKFQVFLNDSMVDGVRDMLAKYRSIYCLYIGSSNLRSTWTYGRYYSFENVLSAFEVSDLSLEIRGMVNNGIS